MNPIVEVVGLRHSFGTTEALRGVSFEVRRGEIVGLLGPNGAGKTTAIQVLLTLLRADSGTVRVAGRDVTVDPAGVRREIGWVPQERAVDPLLTARENLQLVGGLHHLTRTAAAARAVELLGLVDLRADADRVVREFSGGMRRRLELAMGMIHRPELLILDEPTIGLDIAARRTLWGQLSRIRDLGTTILLTTHYLDEADSLCDRVAIIDAGRILAIDTPTELKRRHGRDRIELEFPIVPEGLPRALDEIESVNAIRHDGTVVTVFVSDVVRAMSAVVATWAAYDAAPADLRIGRASLDDVFLDLTGAPLPGDRSTPMALA